ncbi:MAG: alanine dehydrogenase [Chitinophagaceae bacterium]|nr:MAG: alanine dehydrogenase [Chitinophagaceae bacterium]
MKKIGILKEGKIPQDSRVALTPKQCKSFISNFPETEILVQSSETRCFHDNEYRKEGIKIVEDLSDCDILLGIKEVPPAQLIAEKTYLFFSHTIKEQAYNRKLLQTVIEKNIRLIDYECLVDSNGERVIAFGRFAGIVGAHNGLMAFGKKTKKFNLPRVGNFKDEKKLFEYYKSVKIPPIRIALTGTGRVAKGAEEVLKSLSVKNISPQDFLNKPLNEAVYAVLSVSDLYTHKQKNMLEEKDFYSKPADYKSTFLPYTKKTDLMINAIYWDPSAPVFFTKEDMRNRDFSIKVIADITCDIEGSIPATIRSSTIDEPVYGYNPFSEKETKPYLDDCIDIMAVDNLPNELPRDASESFGKVLSEKILPALTDGVKNEIIEKAEIAVNGKLTNRYNYLENFVKG